MNTFQLIQIGLCTTKGEIKSKIVLAGDPKQLDATCRSNIAAELGFKVSLMERLFKRPLYEKHPTTKTYNPRYITQLIRNYRSHLAILYAPNFLFYDSDLIAAAPEGLSKNTHFT